MIFSKLFHVFKDDNLEEHEHYVLLDDFFNLLRKTDTDVRRYNINRTFKNYKGGIKLVNNKQAVSVVSILKYIFSYCESSTTCISLARDIEKELLTDKATKESRTVNSSFDIYKLIAKTKFQNLDVLFENTSIDETNIKTLIAEHKPCFTAPAWKKICWFETHFSKTLEQTDKELGFEEILRLKYSKFQSIVSIQTCRDEWSTASKQQIKTKHQRIETAEQLNQTEIAAAKKHIPSVIDTHLTSLVHEEYGEAIENVISFDCPSSVEHNVLHAVLEIQNKDIAADISDVCERLFYFLKRKHNIFLEKVDVLLSESLSNFKFGETIYRFHLRDSVQNGSLCSSIITSWHAKDLLESEVGFRVDTLELGDRTCQACFQMDEIKPLSAKEFDILQEWFLEIPVETQILFDAFINRKSLRKASRPDTYLCQKLEKLYSVYDILLNAYNKNFIGIFQQVNTEELLTEYKSINSVFDVTSSAGATSSLVFAENKMKRKSDQDLCYFNTYLKRYKLQYSAVTGELEKEVNLRDCHLIMMLDNLVKFKFATNPNPSEIESKQLCTLPITLQGLPEDSSITEHWHTEECNGTPNCICKQSGVLTQKDINSVLLKLNEDEKNAHKQFQHLMVWGYSQLWRRMPGTVYELFMELSFCIYWS